MKIPKVGNFFQEEGSIIAVNDETEEEIIVFEDEQYHLVMRSMMEDDIFNVMKAYGGNSRKRKQLKKKLEKKESQMFNFVLEEMNIYDEKGQRQMIADCQINEEMECKLQIHIKNYNSNQSYAQFLRERTLCTVQKVLAEMNIDTEPEIFRVSKI